MIYLRVKLRKERTLARSEYADVATASRTCAPARAATRARAVHGAAAGSGRQRRLRRRARRDRAGAARRTQHA